MAEVGVISKGVGFAKYGNMGCIRMQRRNYEYITIFPPLPSPLTYSGKRIIKVRFSLSERFVFVVQGDEDGSIFKFF